MLTNVILCVGGGLGGTRKGGPDVNTKYSGREEFSRYPYFLARLRHQSHWRLGLISRVILSVESSVPSTSGMATLNDKDYFLFNMHLRKRELKIVWFSI